jgi:hypothetical protein
LSNGAKRGRATVAEIDPVLSDAYRTAAKWPHAHGVMLSEAKHLGISDEIVR